MPGSDFVVNSLNKSRYSLRLQVGLLLAGALAALWLAIGWEFQKSENDTLARIGRETGTLALAFAEYTESVFLRADGILIDLREDWVVRPRVFAESVARDKHLLADTAFQVAVIDAQGFLAYSNLAPAGERIYLGDREHFKVHRESGSDRLFISRPIKGRVSGKWSIQLTRPIYDRGKFAGVIILSLDPGYLSRFYEKLDTGAKHLVLVVRDTGEIMVRSIGQEKYIGMVVSTSPYTDPGAPLQGNLHRKSQADGIDRITGYVRLPARGITVRIGADLGEQMEAVRTQQQILLSIGACVTLLLAYMAWQILRGLAQRNAAEREAASSQEQYRMLTESMKDVVWVLDAEALRFLYVSPSVKGLRGYTPEEVMAESADAALTPEDREIFVKRLSDSVAALRAGRISCEDYFTNEVEQPCKDGSKVWTEVITHFWQNRNSGLIELHGVTRDITERKRAEERMRHMAQHDALTGLPNRSLFNDRMGAALAAARRDHTKLALVFIDLDRFKQINDNLGHGVGDAVLKELARRIQGAIRESDTAARIGGDEFVILLRDISGKEDALMVAEKIGVAIKAPFPVGSHTLVVSASIGIALYPEGGACMLELSRNADEAMYRAKASGRDTAVIYDVSMEGAD